MTLSRWQALGNTYLLAEQAEALTPDRVRELTGDADGILEVLSSEGAHAEIKVWNADGSVAEMSGNGARIAAAWLARRAGATSVALRVGERDVSAAVDGDLVVLDAGHADVGKTEAIDAGGEHLDFTPVSVGNPHAVVRRDPSRGELLRIGPLLERHPRFPDRTNVQLVRVDGLHDLTVGVWERGVGGDALLGNELRRRRCSRDRERLVHEPGERPSSGRRSARRDRRAGSGATNRSGRPARVARR